MKEAMRNISKITTLESKFPLLSVEQGCMVSKDADITVAFRVELPELFTVTSTEYEAMHSPGIRQSRYYPITASYTSRTGSSKRTIKESSPMVD